MIEKKPDAEILRNYEATLYPDKGGGWEWQGAGVARAVMDFKNDISGLIPVIGKVVEAGAYNAKSNVVGFHKGELRVVISHNRMLVYGTDDEGEIARLVEWMIQKISDDE